MKSVSEYEQMLRSSTFEKAAEVAEALIASEAWAELDGLVEAAANQGRASYLCHIGDRLMETNKAMGFDVAFLAACIVDRGWWNEENPYRKLLDSYAITGDLEVLHTLVNLIYLEDLLESEKNDFLNEITDEVVKRGDFDAGMTIVSSATRHGDADRAYNVICEMIAAAGVQPQGN